MSGGGDPGPVGHRARRTSTSKVRGTRAASSASRADLISPIAAVSSSPPPPPSPSPGMMPLPPTRARARASRSSSCSLTRWKSDATTLLRTKSRPYLLPHPDPWQHSGGANTPSSKVDQVRWSHLAQWKDPPSMSGRHADTLTTYPEMDTNCPTMPLRNSPKSVSCPGRFWNRGHTQNGSCRLLPASSLVFSTEIASPMQPITSLG